jgi:hypothetical protein
MKLYLPKDLSFIQKIDYLTDRKFRNNYDERIRQITLNNLPETPKAFIGYLKETIAPLPPEKFDRTVLKSQKVYWDTLTEIKENLGDLDEELKTAFAEGQIAEWAGIHLARNHLGTSGSYRVKNLEGKTIAIFKPTRESPHGEHNPHFWIRIRNWIQKCLAFHRATDETKGAAAETFAYQAAEILGFQGLVPKTSQLTFESHSFRCPKSPEAGSFQLFVPDAHDGYTHMGIPSWMPPFLAKRLVPKGEEKTATFISEASFHEFALLQCLIGNLDSNYGNMLFTKKTDKIVSIDAWFSMPHSTPTSYLDRRGMHAWDTLFWAERPIPKEFKNLLETHNDLLLQTVRELFGEDSKEEQAFAKRVTDLIEAIDQGDTWKHFTAKQ